MSDAKIKEGLFVGPKIRELKQDVKFEGQLNEVEKVEWKLIKNITMGNHEAKNCVNGGRSCTILQNSGV